MVTISNSTVTPTPHAGPRASHPQTGIGFSDNFAYASNAPREDRIHPLSSLARSVVAQIRSALSSVRNLLTRTKESEPPKQYGSDIYRESNRGGATAPRQSEIAYRHSAIDAYVSGAGDFVSLNKALRSNEGLAPDMQAWAESISRELHSAPPSMRYDGETYRGLRLDKAVLQHCIEVGLLTEPAFMSATTHIGTAASFAKSIGGDRVPVLLVIRNNDQGVNVSLLENASLEGNESEVLYDRTRQLRILSVTPPARSTQWHQLEVELVNGSVQQIQAAK